MAQDTTHDAGTASQQKGDYIPKERFNEVYGKMKDLERKWQQVEAFMSQLGVNDLNAALQAYQAAIYNDAAAKFAQVLADVGVASQVHQYLAERGINIPQLAQAAQQTGTTAQQQGYEDPELLEVRKQLQALQQSIQQLTQSMQAMQTERQQMLEAEIAETLRAEMEDAIREKMPNAPDAVVEAAIAWMSDQALRQYEQLNLPPSAGIDAVIDALKIPDLAGQYAEAIQQIAPAAQSGSTAQSTTQPVTEQPTVPPAVQGQGPNQPDEDAWLKAREEELIKEAVAGAATESAGPPPVPEGG